MTTRTVFGLFLIGLLLFLGCTSKGRGLKVEYVSGVVTLDGQPLADAAVTFHPKSEGGSEVAAAGYSDANGVYKLSSTDSNPQAGTTEGEYSVTISKVEIHDPSSNMSAEEAATAGLLITHTQLLPAIYLDPQQTPLSATVKKGKNKIDLTVKSKP